MSKLTNNLIVLLKNLNDYDFGLGLERFSPIHLPRIDVKEKFSSDPLRIYVDLNLGDHIVYTTLYTVFKRLIESG